MSLKDLTIVLTFFLVMEDTFLEGFFFFLGHYFFLHLLKD